MQTYMANPDKIERKWYVVDADGCTLGRLASGVASVLRGKNKPQFTPHVDTGDYVIIVNADKIKVFAPLMSVPEAPVHQNTGAIFPQHDVRLARQPG